MINRINLILQAKNITAKQFAEEIGIQPSGMSHILGGRNNPSLDFVNKVLRRYPEIDANWLLLGRGQMYGGMASGGSRMEEDEHHVDKSEPTLFSEGPSDTLMVAEPRHEPMTQQEAIDEEERQHRIATAPPEPIYAPSYIASAPTEESDKNIDRAETSVHRLARLLFVYSDHTFEEYRPR